MRLTYEELLQDLAGLNPEEKQKYLWYIFKHKANLHLFGRYCFPHIIKGDYDTPECHLDLIAAMSKPTTDAIIFPRGHAKTTWEKIDTIHDILYALEPVILYIGNTKPDAQFHLESIKGELEGNEILREIFGDLVPPESNLSRKWTNHHIETVNGVNMLVRGAGKGRGVNVKNQRPTKVIADDIEDDEQVQSAMRREKLHNWIHNVILQTLDKTRGKFKFIGTVIHPFCEVLLFFNQFGGIKRAAIEDGKPIWPQVFTEEVLERVKKDSGTRTFNQEYLNNPVNEETSIIKRSWLADKMFSSLSPAGLRKILMFDPQAGEKEGADFFGLALLGYYKGDARRYLMQSKRGKLSQLGQAALIIRTWQADPSIELVGIEKVLNQVACYQLIVDWKAGNLKFEPQFGVDNSKRDIPIIAVNPEGKDKVARLQIHEAAAERGELYFQVSLTDFIDRLVAFPNLDHDDDIDAYVYALTYSYRNNRFTSNEGKSYNGSGTIAGNITNKRF